MQTQELLVQHWYRLAFLPIPYRSLLVEVRGQLQEPRGFNSCHISHVVFSSLDDFIVHYPGRKETKMNSVCCQAMRESWFTAYLDSFAYRLPEVALTEWQESLWAVIQPLASFSELVRVLHIKKIFRLPWKQSHILADHMGARYIWKHVSYNNESRGTHNWCFQDRIWITLWSHKGRCPKHQNPAPTTRRAQTPAWPSLAPVCRQVR